MGGTMNTQSIRLDDLRIWRDEQLGQLWRVAYPEGDDGEIIVAFPDTAALSDFLSEHFGLALGNEYKHKCLSLAECSPYTYVPASDTDVHSCS
jgi:hypothetical protein